MWRTVVVVALLASACTKPNPAVSCGDGVCDDPEFPFCDTSGAIGGSPNSCIAQECDASSFIACNADQLITCSPDGDDFSFTDCDHGCNADTGACNQCTPNEVVCSGDKIVSCDANGNPLPDETCAHTCIDDNTGPHCDVLQARYLDGICDQPAIDDLTISQNGTLDADLDTTCNGGVVAQTAAPSICVLRYRTVSIASGVTLTFTSSLNAADGPTRGRPVAIVADELVDVSGTIDVGARGSASGPGGGITRSGGLPTSGIGGGGAGFKKDGGAGGNNTTDGGAANGGTASSDPALLSAFVGGPTTTAGGGGGALTLIACRGTVSVTGTLSSGGGGGGGANSLLGSPLPGFGGGAGGYVVLQGLAIDVTGKLFANGGGGGAGSNGAVGGKAQNGEDGPASGTVAAKGGTALSGAGVGGIGGLLSTTISPPGKGGHRTDTTSTPGGGGGSVGFLQTYTPSDVTPSLAPSSTSPSFEVNATVPTK